MSARMPQESFAAAIVAQAEDYRALEDELRRHPDTAAWLAAAPPWTDPLEALLARVIHAWIHDPSDQRAALAYLDAEPGRFEGAPMRGPIPLGTADDLLSVFGDRIVPLIALRLLKDTDDPPWRVLAEIFYLGVAQDPQATVPLIRFVVTTPSERQRHYGARALRDIRDPDLVAKLRAEQRAAMARGSAWPAELEALLR